MASYRLKIRWYRQQLVECLWQFPSVGYNLPLSTFLRCSRMAFTAQESLRVQHNMVGIVHLVETWPLWKPAFWRLTSFPCFLTIMFEILRPRSLAPEWGLQPLSLRLWRVSFCRTTCTVTHLDLLECIHRGLSGTVGFPPFVEIERPRSPCRLNKQESKEQEEWLWRIPFDGAPKCNCEEHFPWDLLLAASYFLSVQEAVASGPLLSPLWSWQVSSTAAFL